MVKPFRVSPPAQQDYRVLGTAKDATARAAARVALDKAHAARKSDAVHVTKRPSGWAIKTEGRERASAVKPTKIEAVDSARAVAAKKGARLIEHGADGKITRNTEPRRR
jgi:uncharacterized protein YdaT